MANINPNEKQCKSQSDRILSWLKKGHTLTQLQAYTKFSCMRLPARINDLRKAGNIIEMKLVVVGKEKKRVAQYTLREAA